MEYIYMNEDKIWIPHADLDLQLRILVTTLCGSRGHGGGGRKEESSQRKIHLERGI